MNAIRSVFAAFTNLAASVNALAGVIDVAAGRLRQHLALDGDMPRAFDYQPAEEPDATANGTATKRKARTNA
ncbi:MAG TPA: hypothetical protein VH575_23910 [Gemmataceae bacterium]|jgi:hypothetical protein